MQGFEERMLDCYLLHANLMTGKIFNKKEELLVKIARGLGIFVGFILLAFVLFFCYEGYIFHFSLPARVYYKATSDLFEKNEEILKLFENAKLRGCAEETTIPDSSDNQVVLMGFSYSSVYDGKSGKIYYKFHNYGESIIWIKSETLRRLTGKLWKIRPGNELYFTMIGPPALETETGKLDLLYEEKILGITFRFSGFGTSMDLLVPHEHKF